MSTIFRDPTEGATARRQDLLRRRRDELVMMPHAIRRVFVARRARTAASIVVCLAGTALLVTAATPSLARFFAGGLPGINPAVLSTFVVGMWLAGLFTYVAARALDEHRFAVAMSRFVMPSKDLDQDIERLSHEHPDQAARAMAHRLEVRSAALPVLAASVLLPVTALFVVHAIRVRGWPVIAEIEASFGAHAKPLIGSALVGIVVAVVMTRRFARLPQVAPIALAVALGGGVLALASWHWFGTGALLAATIALVVRKLRSERVQLEAEDPAAGSEVFTWRGFVQRLRTTAGHLRGRNGRVALMSCAFLGAALYPAASHKSASQVTAQAPNPFAASNRSVSTVQPSNNKSGSSYRVQADGDGHLKYTIDLADEQPLDIKDFAGVGVVPAAWSARIEIETGSDGDITVTSNEITKQVTRNGTTWFVTSACDMRVHPLGLRVESKPGHYTLRVKVALEPAGC